MNIVYWWPEYEFNITALSIFHLYICLEEEKFLYNWVEENERGLFITKLLNSLAPFGWCAKKSLTDLSSDTILNDLSVHKAFSSSFSFVESIPLETISLAKWFSSSLCSHFFVTPVPTFLATPLLGGPRGFTIQTVHYYKTGWVRDTISFTERESGLVWKKRWKPKTTSGDLDCTPKANRFWKVFVRPGCIISLWPTGREPSASSQTLF